LAEVLHQNNSPGGDAFAGGGGEMKGGRIAQSHLDRVLEPAAEQGKGILRHLRFHQGFASIFTTISSDVPIRHGLFPLNWVPSCRSENRTGKTRQKLEGTGNYPFRSPSRSPHPRSGRLKIRERSDRLFSFHLRLNAGK